MTVFRKLARELSGECGTTAVMYVIMASTFLFAFAAIAVDWGMLAYTRSDKQNAVDAAALAGAASLPQDVPGAQATAVAYAVLNTEPADQITTEVAQTYVPNDTIRVIALDPAVPTWFAQLLGIPSKPVGAEGSAIIGSKGEFQCVLPLGLMDPDGEPYDEDFGFVFGQLYQTDLGAHFAVTPGNFQGLALYGHGAKAFEGGIAGDEDFCAVPVAVNSYVPPKTGNMVGPGAKGFEDRVGVKADSNGIIWCPDDFEDVAAQIGTLPDGTPVYDIIAPSNCLAVAPVIAEYSHGASDDVLIIAFVNVFLERWDKGTTDHPYESFMCDAAAVAAGRCKNKDLGTRITNDCKPANNWSCTVCDLNDPDRDEPGTECSLTCDYCPPLVPDQDHSCSVCESVDHATLWSRFINMAESEYWVPYDPYGTKVVRLCRWDDAVGACVQN